MLAAVPDSLEPRNSRGAIARLGILADFAEEGWPSMDLCAEMLSLNLRRDWADRLALVDLRPPFRRRLQRIPILGRRRAAFNGDRLANRFWDYPRYAASRRGDADAFHVVDHSYAQLVESLPAERTGVYCHDLDAFRCLISPEIEPRPRWFRSMARRILNGLQKAALVFYSNRIIGAEIERVVDRARMVHAPLGFADEFRPDPIVDEGTQGIWNSIGDRPYLLHVGTCIPRKRIDVLLQVFARLLEGMPELRLVKVGGEWTSDHREFFVRRGLMENVVHVRGLGRIALACLYRRASLVLVPSEAEGFGLPVLEALACGAPVLASDLAVLREIAGSAASFAAVGNIDDFVWKAREMLGQPESERAVAERVGQARLFSWQRHAEIIGEAYRRLIA